VPTLAPGKTQEVRFTAMATKPGPFTRTATATGSRGTAARAESSVAVIGVPAIRMELLDTADPVEKNGETTYEIRVMNTGNGPDTNLVVTCELPPQLRLIEFKGPTGNRLAGPTPAARVTFDPITELAPKTEAVFRVTVKAVGSGDVRVKASLTSSYLKTPVTKEESTRVYGE
jgi:uncharacterized repeat protein (TIGR01451 family)